MLGQNGSSRYGVTRCYGPNSTQGRQCRTCSGTLDKRKREDGPSGIGSFVRSALQLSLCPGCGRQVKVCRAGEYLAKTCSKDVQAAILSGQVASCRPCQFQEVQLRTPGGPTAKRDCPKQRRLRKGTHPPNGFWIKKRCTVGASPSDALERVRRVEVPASS